MSFLGFLHQSPGNREVKHTLTLCFKDDHRVEVHSEVKGHNLTKTSLSV